MCLNDEKLVSQTLSGDREAFGVLVGRYQELVYTYAFQQVDNETDAHDVTQEVFLRAYRHLGQLRSPHRFRSWLYTIVSNECNRWLVRVTKRRKREILIEAAKDEAVWVQPEHTLPTADWEVDLENALSDLSDDNRVAVSMFYMSNCSLREIAEFLGVSENTVKGKLFRARQQLGRVLEKYDRGVKKNTLKGGFLAQTMKQIGNTPAPTLTCTSWSSTAVGKAVFALITAVYILIGGIAVQNDSTARVAKHQIGMGSEDVDSATPIEVVLLTAIPPGATSTLPPVVPKQTERRPSAPPAGASSDRGRWLADRNGPDPPSRSPTTVAKAEAEKRIFSGRVIDHNGVPVVDAEILYPVARNPLKSVTRTDADGTFRFELPDSNSKKDGLVHILATHRDYAFGWQQISPQETTDVALQLSPPASISGKIVNNAGEPIQNAEVRIRALVGDSKMAQMASGNHERLWSDNIPIAAAKTDANGAFIIRELPQEAKIELTVQAQGYAKQMHFSVPAGTEGLEFQMKREGRIKGHLSYAKTGAPVKGAIVSVKGIRVNDSNSVPGAARANTDANGNYLLKSLSPGTYNLFLHRGPEGWTASAKERIKVVEGQTVSNMDLTLVRGGIIVGRVTDQATKVPLVNHHVSLHDAARPESQKSLHLTRTDETGAYFFRAVPGPAVVLTTAPQGYVDVGPIKKRVEVTEAKTSVVDFQFLNGIKLKGRAVTEAGEPIRGARIINVKQPYKPHSKSNAHGKFAVRGLRSGQKLVLKAEHSGLKLRGTVEVEVQLGESVEIQMQPYELVKVSGRVVNSAGEPMPSARISLTHWNTAHDVKTVINVSVTGGDGRFKDLELIVGDEYAISASAKGYQRTTTKRFTATATMSQIADLVLLSQLKTQ